MSLQLKLIGFPIQHSLSPWIHQSFLERTGIEGAYTLHEIAPEDSFSEQIESLRASDIDGFNVTVPYKQKIIPFLDQLDITAELMGAVNTVVVEDGKWIGYNTDGTGYVQALLGKYPELAEKKHASILLLGAGGAARGIFHGLLREGYNKVTLANRTTAKGQAITEGTQASVITLDRAEESVGEYDVVIQTSSVGMNTEKQIIDLQNLTEGTIVSDIVYQPLETNFLKQAAEKGGRLHYGHTMLLYQAQKAFEIWSKKEVNIKGMDEALIIQLRGGR